MTDHDWYRRKLPVAAAGIASLEQQDRIREHRETCDECRERWLQYQSHEADDAHLSSSMVARWPRACAKLAGMEREMVRRHLSRCEECREDLRLAGFEPAFEPATEKRPSVLPTRPRTWWRGVAAGAAVTALAASLAWMVLMPRATPDRGGAVPWVIPSQLRGGSVTIAEGTREIALTLATPLESDATRPAVLEVFDPDDQPLLRAEIEPEQLERSTLIVMVRSRRPLAPGGYRVLLLQSADDGAPMEIESRFELVIRK